MIGGCRVGKATIDTVTSDGRAVRVVLPGMSLFPKKGVDINLVSHSTLVLHGWFVDLNSSVAISPTGLRFKLEKRGSSWYFPYPRRKEKTTTRYTPLQESHAANKSPKQEKKAVEPKTFEPKTLEKKATHSLADNFYSTLAVDADSGEAAQGDEEIEDSIPSEPSLALVSQVKKAKRPRPQAPKNDLEDTADQLKIDPMPELIDDEEEPEDDTKEFMNPKVSPCDALLFAMTCSAGMRSHTGTGIEADLSDEVVANLDKWDALHRSSLHTVNKRLRKIAKNMDPSDPNRPALNTYEKWIHYRKCGDCAQGKSKKPPHDAEHPRLGADRYDFKPGEFLWVDGTGAFNNKTDDGLEQVPTVDGSVTTYVITDHCSNSISHYPVKQATNEAFIGAMNEYSARSGVKILKIRGDGAFINDGLRQWARTQQPPIDIDGSAPDTQEQNGRSEGSVKITKDAYRTAKIRSCLSDNLIAYGYQNCAQQHNRIPSTRDPEKKHRSPMQQFQKLPWEHRSLPIAPYGCRCFPHVGKKTGSKSSNVRAIAGVYLCHDPYKAGHQVLNLNTNTIETYAYVTFDPHRFPLRELLLAGEPEQDFDPAGWRKYAPLPPMGVDDRALGEFLSGKQIELTIPQSVYPDYPGNWEVKAYELQTYNNAYALKCVFTGYNGDHKRLRDHDLRTLKGGDNTLWIQIPMSSNGPKGASTWISSCYIRDIMKTSYPTATTLADFATLSTAKRGSFPPHPFSTGKIDLDSVLSDDQVLQDGEVSDDTVGRDLNPAPAVAVRPSAVVLPARPVGRERSNKAAKGPRKSEMVRDRQQFVRQTRSSTQLQRSSYAARAYPSKGIVLLPSDDGRVGFEPSNLAQARNHESWPLWKQAMIKEDQGLISRGTYSRVNKSDVPSHVKIMGSQYVFKDKRITGAKARIVVRGDQQYPKPDTADTYAATPTPTEVRILISTAVQNNYALHSLDVSQAFVQSDELKPETEYYIYPPQGSNEPPGTVWKLRRPLYGLAVAPRAWSDTFRAFLKSYGFTPVNHSDTFFKWSDSTNTQHMHLVYHVDDILLSFSHDSCGAEFKRALCDRFIASDEGSISRYLGIRFTRTSKGIFLSQEDYATEVLERFKMLDCNPRAAPLDAHYTVSKDDCPKVPDPARRLKYQEIVGSLQYLVQWTRPDLAFSTNELAKVSNNPSEGHLKDAYQVLRYLKGSANLGLTYTRDGKYPNRLIAAADADFAACVTTRRSISSYVCMLNGGAVSWKSRQQKAVATSTSQAEFVSASWAADEVLWLRRTLLDINVPQTQPTPLWEDNRACRMMSENPVHRERSKHIDYRVHALRERVADGHVRLLDCPTVDMYADMGTKSLPAPAHIKHRDTVLGYIEATTPQIPADLTKRGGGGLSVQGG